MTNKRNPSIVAGPTTLSHDQRKAVGALNYVKREREPGEATPNDINLMEQKDYDPSKHLSYRSGIAQ